MPLASSKLPKSNSLFSNTKLANGIFFFICSFWKLVMIARFSQSEIQECENSKYRQNKFKQSYFFQIFFHEKNHVEWGSLYKCKEIFILRTYTYFFCLKDCLMFVRCSSDFFHWLMFMKRKIKQCLFLLLKVALLKVDCLKVLWNATLKHCFIFHCLK